MEKKSVVAILNFYKDIDKRILMNERVIKNLEDQYYDNLKAVNINGMPHGSGNTSNPTEQTALNIPNFVTNTIQNLRQENITLEKIKAETLQELAALDYRQQSVVFGFYIEGLKWEQISEQMHYSPRMCRGYRDKGINNLRAKFERNSIISKFNFPDS